MPSISAPESNPVQAIDGLCKLPSLRPVALKILKLLSQDDVKLAEIARLLQSDPGFSAEVLTLANSPLYGARQPIHQVSLAISFLGLDRIQSLMMRAAMRSFTSRMEDSEEIRKSWRHSVACALLAEEMSPIYNLSTDQAYTAGLLHDVGRLALLKAFAKQYGLLLNEVYETLDDVHASEQAVFKMDHSQAGLWVTKTWGFPEDFSEIAAHHHACPENGKRRMIGLIEVSCSIADVLGFGAVQYRQVKTAEEVVLKAPSDLRDRFFSNWDVVRERVEAKLESLNSLSA